MSLTNIVEGIISRPTHLRQLTEQIALEIKENPKLDPDFIAANAPEGMVPGWQLREELGHVTERTTVPYVYIREKRKKGGHKEIITGDQNNELINPGDKAVIVGLEGNSVDRIRGSMSALKKKGYEVQGVVTITHPSDKVRKEIDSFGLELCSYMTPQELANYLKKEVEAREMEKLDHRELNSDEIIRMIVNEGALEIRDLEAGEEPFLYSSGLWGPGYLMIKGLVGKPHIMNELVWQLALRLKDKELNFIIGNVTGGVIPGYQLRNYLEALTGKEVPFVYAEGSRLLGDGLVKGRIVGDSNNPMIQKGDKALVIEESVNTAGSVTGATIRARDAGYQANEAATIFHYVNPLALDRMEKYNVNFTFLTTLPETLRLAEKEELFNPRAIQDYREFIEDPMEYQEKWGLEPVKEGGTE